MCAGNWVRGRGGSKLWLFFSISNFIFSFPVSKTDRLKKNLCHLHSPRTCTRAISKHLPQLTILTKIIYHHRFIYIQIHSDCFSAVSGCKTENRVLVFCVSPFTPKTDKHLIYPYSITPKSNQNIQVMRIYF